MFETNFMKLGVRQVLAVAIVGSAAWLSGCESKEDANLAKAQACLDSATPTTAESCSAMVGSDQSQKAYLIRCASLYIKNGFVGDRIANAFQRIKDNPSGGTDPMVTGMTLMAFTAQSESDLATTYCTKSGVRSMERLATFTAAATFIAVNGQIGSIPAEGLTEAQVQTAITNVKNQINAGTLSPEQLGTIATQMEASYCQEGSSFSTNSVCKNLTAAVAAGNTADVAKELLNQLQTN